MPSGTVIEERESLIAATPSEAESQRGSAGFFLLIILSPFRLLLLIFFSLANFLNQNQRKKKPNPDPFV